MSYYMICILQLLCGKYMCASRMAEAIAPSLAVAAVQAKDVCNLVYNRGHQNANPRK